MTEWSAFIGLSVALGIGLLVGAERERRKGSGPAREAAGIRTFAVASLSGAVGHLLGGGLLLAAIALVAGALVTVAYYRQDGADPGLTTELALPLTVLLGGLAMRDAVLAAGVGTGLAVLLAMRERLHRFVRRVLSAREWHDALLFAAAALIALPLAPDRALGPFDAIHPHRLAQLVVLAMAISASGYVATRLLGPRHGLAVAGLAGGFVSSTATIHALGAHARRSAAALPGAAAGAVLSSVATLAQMIAVLWLLQPAVLASLRLSLAAGITVAVAYAAWMVRRAARERQHLAEHELGRAFDLTAAVSLAGIVGATMVLSAALHAWLGSGGVAFSAAIAGLADVHAAAAAVAQLVASGTLAAETGTGPILIALSSNAAMKAFIAYRAGGPAYAMRIIPGLAAMTAAMWGAAQA